MKLNSYDSFQQPQVDSVYMLCAKLRNISTITKNLHNAGTDGQASQWRGTFKVTQPISRRILNPSAILP